MKMRSILVEKKTFFWTPSSTKGPKYLPTHTNIQKNSPRWVNYWGLKYFETMVSKQNIYKGSQELIRDLPAHTFFYKLRVGPACVLSMWRYMLQELEERKEDRAKRTRVESNHRKLSWPMYATSNKWSSTNSWRLCMIQRCSHNSPSGCYLPQPLVWKIGVGLIWLKRAGPLPPRTFDLSGRALPNSGRKILQAPICSSCLQFRPGFWGL